MGCSDEPQNVWQSSATFLISAIVVLSKFDMLDFMPRFLPFICMPVSDLVDSPLLCRLVKNPPPTPGKLFLGVASRSASGRDLTRVPKPNSNIWETDE